jgi:TP901 family phage tail tape measure protein
MALKVGELFATLGLDSKGFEKGVDKSGSKWDNFGKNMVGKGKAAAAGAAAAIVGLTVKSVTEFASLEKGMNEVFTLMPGISRTAMSKMTDQVRSFGKEFGVLPDETVPALYQAISAGVPAGNVFDFLETAQKAAIAGVTDLTTSVDGISSVVNAYGAEVIDATRASDLMFSAVKLGKTNFEQLSASLFNVIPTAASLGVGFEDVTAALAAMTAQGTPTSVATTQMRQLLVELSKEGSATAATFEGIAGKSFRDFIASGGNVEGALQMMATEASKSGGSISDMFGSVEAGAAAAQLTSESGAKASSGALTEMASSAGATEKAYSQMDQGLSRSWDKMKAAAHDTMLELGEELAPTVMGLMDSLMQLAETAMPAVKFGMDMVAGAARGLTFIIDGLGDLFGFTDGRAADLARNQQFLAKALKDGKDPATALANALADMARTGKLTEDEFNALARQSGLTDERIADVKATLLDYAASGKDAEVTTRELKAAFGEAGAEAASADQKYLNMAAAMNETETAAAGVGEETEELTTETASLAEMLDAAREAQESLANVMLEAASPLLKAVGAVDSLKAAEERLNEVREDSEASASDLAAAELEVFEALLKAQGAMDELSPDELNAAIDSIAEVLGKSTDEVEEMLRQLDLLDGKKVTTFVETQLSTIDTGTWTPRAHGGQVNPNTTYRMGEGNRPEMLVIPGDRGRVFSYGDTMRMMQALDSPPAGMGGAASGDAAVAASIEKLVEQLKSGSQKSASFGDIYAGSDTDAKAIVDEITWRMLTAGV